MTALALSVLLALVSSVCYAAGAILQEHVAATAQESYAPLRRGSWWAAVSLNGAGAVLHVLALAYGPLSVVQPLGALTIVFALPMAAVFVRRRVGAAGWRGALLATVGLAGLLSLTGSAPAEALSDVERIAVAAITVGSIVALTLTARWVRRPAVRSVLLATAAGTAFGISSVFTKNVTVAWSWASSAEALPSLLVIALLSGAGVFLSQAAYRGAGLAAPLATATVVNPVVATAVGMAALGEHFRHGLPGTALAVLAAAVASAGLAMLAAHGAGEAQPADAVPAGRPAGTVESGSSQVAGSVPAGSAEEASPSPAEGSTGPEGRASGPAGAAAPEFAAGPARHLPPAAPSPAARPRLVRQVRRSGAGPTDFVITVLGPAGAGRLAVPRPGFVGPTAVGPGDRGRGGGVLQPHG